MNDQIIFRLQFPFVQTEALLDFIKMRRRDAADAMDRASTVAALRGARSEDGVLGALEVQFQEIHDSMLFGDAGYNGTSGVIMNAKLHEWLVDAMNYECQRHEQERNLYTGFATTEVHLWKNLTNAVAESVPYEGDAPDTRLVQDDPSFDRLLQEVK